MGAFRIAAGAALIMVLLSGCASDPTANGHTPPRYTAPPSVFNPDATPPSTPDPAPAAGAGLAITVGVVDAGLGHRGTVLTLTNHDTRPLPVTGYPDLKVLAADGSDLRVRVVHGTSYFAKDPGPRTTTLPPNGKLLAVLSWSATVTDGQTQTGAAITVAPGKGGATQTLPLKTDLGTTGEVTVSAWAAKLSQ